MTGYFATCARGLEPLLARELTALGANSVEPGRGGVAFSGDDALAGGASRSLRSDTQGKTLALALLAMPIDAG